MILLLELCSLDIPHSSLLRSFSSVVDLLKSLAIDTGDIFSKVCSLNTWWNLVHHFIFLARILLLWQAGVQIFLFYVTDLYYNALRSHKGNMTKTVDSAH